MNKVARALSQVFHPLLMPTLGLLLILNSGTYLALLDPQVKKAILFVLALGTLFFPLLILPVMYYRRVINSLSNNSREGRMIFYMVVLILYVITFVYFMRLPLNHVIHSFILSALILVLLLFSLTIRFNICTHSAGLGGMAGLIIALLVLFETPMELAFMAVILAAGITGSSRIYLGLHRSWEILAGFILGFAVVFGTLLIF